MTAQLPTWERILYRRRIRRLRHAVASDEVVREVCAGLRGGEALIIAATDRRLLLVASIDHFEEWPYEALSGAVGKESERRDERTLAFSGPGHSTTSRTCRRAAPRQ